MEKKKCGKDTARRNSITEALRRRGWRPSDAEEENTHPSNYNINSDPLNGSKSPVMSNTSASKIRKLARQDSRTSIVGNNVQNKRHHTKRGVSANSLPTVQGEMKSRPNSRGSMSR